MSPSRLFKQRRHGKVIVRGAMNQAEWRTVEKADDKKARRQARNLAVVRYSGGYAASEQRKFAYTPVIFPGGREVDIPALVVHRAANDQRRRAAEAFRAQQATPKARPARPQPNEGPNRAKRREALHSYRLKGDGRNGFGRPKVQPVGREIYNPLRWLTDIARRTRIEGQGFAGPGDRGRSH